MQEPSPEDINKIQSSDVGFQQFLTKATRIVLLFLKNRASPQELHRSVLQFLSTAINLLDESILQGTGATKKQAGIAKQIIDTIFSVKSNLIAVIKKHRL